MKIAVSSQGGGMQGEIAEHFGRCPQFVMVEAEGEKVKSAEAIDNPYHSAPVPGALPSLMEQNHVDVVLTGGAGPMAIKRLEQLGIRLVLGCSGKVSDAVQGYLDGRLETGGNVCDL
jgi:predicted Fe-Mo cluster-binding NifX family protein